MISRFIVEINLPADSVVDPSADAEGIQSALWDYFPHLEHNAISVRYAPAQGPALRRWIWGCRVEDGKLGLNIAGPELKDGERVEVEEVVEAAGKDEVDFTPEKVEALRKAYQEAVKAGKDVFVFEGHDVYTPYGKYLLEYLDGLFNRREGK